MFVYNKTRLKVMLHVVEFLPHFVVYLFIYICADAQKLKECELIVHRTLHGNTGKIGGHVNQISPHQMTCHTLLFTRSHS